MRVLEISRARLSELTLGTVQLGMRYGAVNDIGQPTGAQAIEIVRGAQQCGVTAFDTARAYGNAEEVLGCSFVETGQTNVTLITKLDLPALAGVASKYDVRAEVDRSIACSCTALRRDSLDVLLLHGWQQRHGWDAAAWERLLEIRDRGTIRSLGASVYEPHEALSALLDPEIRHLQISMNVLDWRWRAEGVDKAIADRPEVAIYARSALLQGILAHSAQRWPHIGGFDASACVRQLETFAERLGREGVKDLCFAYVRSQPWITSVVVGCETLQQLRDNVRLFSTPLLSRDQCEELESLVPRAPEDLLNPSRWKLRRQVAYAS